MDSLRWMRTILKALLLLVICNPVWALDLSSITNTEATGGLKEALVQGAGKAVGQLGSDGGFLNNPKVRIPLPEKLAPVEQLLRTMGRGKDVDAFIASMNHAAEQAVPKAKPLLLNAVRQMSLSDAKQIVTGGEDAGTRYFKAHTADQLTAAFLPIVRDVIKQSPLAEQYTKLLNKAAQFGLVQQDELVLENYVARKAVDGLYLMIAEEEKSIRKDPLGAAGKLARKVFGG